MQNISKRFGGVVALNNVSLEVRRGEILGLIGENGAGKSTLMNILSGVVLPDSGSIFIDGEEQAYLNPRIAQDKGIQFVHQELSLLPEMTVAENIFLGKEIRTRTGLIDKQECERRSRELLEKFDIDIPVNQKVAELSVAQKQLVEIAKSMVGIMKVLILDEPTSSLTEREMVYLSKVLSLLKERGVGIIFISHKLDEVKELCDSVTVLCDGKVVRTAPIKDVSIEDMVRSMVGRNIEDYYTPSRFGGERKTILEIKGLCSSSYGEVTIKDFDLTVAAGEIVGIFGLIGSGRTELIKTLYGIRPMQKGEIIIDGKRLIHRSPMELISRGVAWVTEDRRNQGICLNMSIKNNIIMPVLRRMSKLGVINEKVLNSIVEDYMSGLSIKAPNVDVDVQNLSGGNQQKVVLAKWLLSKPKLLILDEPTRGIDIGSKSEIHKIIRDLRDQGMAVLVISSELPELFSLSDRIIVMREGEHAGSVDRSDESLITEENIMRKATIGDDYDK